MALSPRNARVVRRTAETQIELSLDLDRPAPGGVATGVGFLDHLLLAMARHGQLGLAVAVAGDAAATGPHHSAEDVGLALGEALRYAIWGPGPTPAGQAAPGVERFGEATVPMDESLAVAVIDLSGRPGCYLDGFDGAPDPCAWGEFLRALAAAGGFTLHLRLLAAGDGHHAYEASAKALGRATRLACRPTGSGDGGETSTKGRVSLAVGPCRS